LLEIRHGGEKEIDTGKEQRRRERRKRERESERK